MANYIGSANEVDHYIGNNLVVAKYIGENKYFDAYSEIEGNLPLAFKARVAHALTDYRIYGTESGAGVQTENLFSGKGKVQNIGVASIKQFIESNIQVSPGETYCINESSALCSRLGFYMNDTRVSNSNWNYVSSSITIPDGCNNIYVEVRNYDYIAVTDEQLATATEIMLTEGSTAPTSYIPYGYELPLTVESGVTENLWENNSIKTEINGVTIESSSSEIHISSSGSSTAISAISDVWKTNILSSDLIGDYSFAYWIEGQHSNLAMGLYKIDDTPIFTSNKNNDNYSFEADGSKYYAGFYFPKGWVGDIIIKIMLTSGSTPPDHYIPHCYESNYNLYIGDSKLGAEEYLDYGEQKVYKRTENLFNKNNPRMQIRQGSYEPSGYTTRYPHVASTGVFQFSAGDYISIISQGASYSRFVKEVDADGKTIRALNFTSNVLLIDSDGLYAVQINKVNIEALTTEDIEYLNDSFVLELSSTAPSSYIPYYQSTDPPEPFPPISTYQGENTLSSEETLGEVTIKGRIREPDPLPEMTGIKAVFEYGGLSGTTWKNKVGANNFTWTSGNEPTDNGTEYVLSGNTFAKAGQYESNDDYSGAVTMYLLAKFEEVKNGCALVVGGLENGYTYGIDIYASNTYGDFATASKGAEDLINPAVPANEYHVIAVTAASSDYRITVYGDGIKQLHTTPKTRLPRNYNGKAALYGMLPSDRSAGNMHVKFVAFGNEKHTEEQIVANSQYIMNKYGIS